jgi:hypothetical protein
VASLRKAQRVATSPASKNSIIEATANIAHTSALALAKELQSPTAEKRITAAISKIKVISNTADTPLGAAEAYIMGPALGAPTLDASRAISGWTGADNFVGWDVEFKEARDVKVQLSLTNTEKESASYRVIMGAPSALRKVPQTPNDTQPVTTEPITFKVTPGIYRLVVVPASLPDGQNLMNLRGVVLKK